MLKTIRGRMILLQTLIIFSVILGLFLVFTFFADNYYYGSKQNFIEKAYKDIEKTDINSLDKDNHVISGYEYDRLMFIICNSSFERVYVTKLEKKPVDAQIQIKNDIVKRLSSYSYHYQEDANNNRISGYGIINQNDEDFYVYIYENKEPTRIFFSYYRIFFVILGVLVLLVAIIISIYVSRKLTRPIVEIERAASTAINSGYTLPIIQSKGFKETESLANSINEMLNQIRLQMTDLEDELVKKGEVEKERRIFINNISHELKTPLAVMSSQIEMLRFIDDEAKKNEYIESMEEEVLKMTDMINDMIVMYAAKSDEKEFLMEKTDIVEIVSNTANQYENLISKNGIILLQEFDQNCEATVNKRYISQAVGNYITNAIKHCKANGKIILRVLDEGDFVRVEVENDGERIADKYKYDIWESFFSRDENITLNGQKSSGIGLAIVKSVMEVHSGEYGFDNKEDGVAFWIKFPKDQSEYTK